MNDVGLFFSSFGGVGLFIWYLITREKTREKEFLDTLRELKKSNNTQSESIDDLTLAVYTFLDYVMPSKSNSRLATDLRSRIDSRRADREKDEVLNGKRD